MDRIHVPLSQNLNVHKQKGTLFQFYLCICLFVHFFICKIQAKSFQKLFLKFGDTFEHMTQSILYNSYFWFSNLVGFADLPDTSQHNKWLSKRDIESLIQLIWSKTLIHSGTKQVTGFMSESLNHALKWINQNTVSFRNGKTVCCQKTLNGYFGCG